MAARQSLLLLLLLILLYNHIDMVQSGGSIHSSQFAQRRLCLRLCACITGLASASGVGKCPCADILILNDRQSDLWFQLRSCRGGNGWSSRCIPDSERLIRVTGKVSAGYITVDSDITASIITGDPAMLLKTRQAESHSHVQMIPQGRREVSFSLWPTTGTSLAKLGVHTHTS